MKSETLNHLDNFTHVELVLLLSSVIHNAWNEKLPDATRDKLQDLALKVECMVHDSLDALPIKVS